MEMLVEGTPFNVQSVVTIKDSLVVETSHYVHVLTFRSGYEGEGDKKAIRLVLRGNGTNKVDLLDFQKEIVAYERMEKRDKESRVYINGRLVEVKKIQIKNSHVLELETVDRQVERLFVDNSIETYRNMLSRLNRVGTYNLNI